MRRGEGLPTYPTHEGGRLLTYPTREEGVIKTTRAAQFALYEGALGCEWRLQFVLLILVDRMSEIGSSPELISICFLGWFM